MPVGEPKTDLVLVDDDKLTLEIVLWNLRKTSYAAQVFSDPEKALSYLSISVPTLLVVDFYMPQMTGVQFLERASRVCKLHESTILLCSAVMHGDTTLALDGVPRIEQIDKESVCDRRLFLKLLEHHL